MTRLPALEIALKLLMPLFLLRGGKVPLLQGRREHPLARPHTLARDHLEVFSLQDDTDPILILFFESDRVIEVLLLLLTRSLLFCDILLLRIASIRLECAFK